MKTIIKSIIPFVILIALITLFYRELFYSDRNEMSSALIGQDVPTFHLVSLTKTDQFFNSEELKGRVSLLNVWASWCYACRVEHPMLMQVSEKYHVPIYSINYKDERIDAKKWLENAGNPYVKTGIDDHGRAAIDLGIYGTPETFVINPKGQIIYRHVGVIDQKTWDDILYPTIQQYQHTK